MSVSHDVESWPDALEAAFGEQPGVVHRAMVLRETDSTQDAARRLSAPIGTVVITGRQTAGRGRLGRAWVDTATGGVAMTCIVPADRPERLAIAAAVAVADAAATLGASQPMIKWPNDVYLDRRKLAGVLIERDDERALVGIGVNVRQGDWPAEISEKAISLAQAGIDVARIDAAAAVLTTLNRALEWTDIELGRAFAERDLLTGQCVTAACGEQRYTGRVAAVHPLRGLEIDVDGRRHWLSAPRTRILAMPEEASRSRGPQNNPPAPRPGRIA